jgi:hypothetical protein
VKELASEYKAALFTEEGTSAPEPATDPTVAHASGTEIAAGDAEHVNGASVATMTNGLSNMQVSDEAANSVGEGHWDTNNDMSISQEWVDVKVPRDPAETDTGLQATPAAGMNTQSWADDTPEAAPDVSLPKNLMYYR